MILIISFNRKRVMFFPWLALYIVVFLGLLVAFFAIFAVKEDGNVLSTGIHRRTSAQLWAIIAAGSTLSPAYLPL